MGKLDFIQIKSFCASKNTINIVKGNPQKASKYFQIKKQYTALARVTQLVGGPPITKRLRVGFPVRTCT